MSERITYSIFAFVMFMCVAILGAACFANFNTNCKRKEPINLCGG